MNRLQSPAKPASDGVGHLSNPMADPATTGIINVSRVIATLYADKTHPRQPIEAGTEEKVVNEIIVRRDVSGRYVRALHSVPVNVHKRWSLCRTHTGRYCRDDCTVCACLCNPCCERSRSDFVNYGVGISNFFKFQKWLIGTFLVMALVTLPSLVLNYLGSGVMEVSDGLGPFPALFRLSVGNLNDRSNASIVLPPDICPFSDSTRCDMPRSFVGAVEATLDTVAMLIFILSWMWLRHHERYERDVVDFSRITIDDYSVFLPDLPSWATKETIQAHFERVNRRSDGTPYRIHHVALVEDKFALISLFVKRGKLFKRLHRSHAEKRELEIEERIEGNRGCCCCSTHSKIAHITSELRRLRHDEHKMSSGIKRRLAATPLQHARLDVQDLEAEIAMKGASGCCNSRAYDLARAKGRLHSLEQRFGEIRDEDVIVEDTVAAFVVFEEEEGKLAALDMYPDVWTYQGCCQSRTYRMHSITGDAVSAAVTVLPAPAPTTVLWENLNVTQGSRGLRGALTMLLSGIVLVVSFIGLYVATQQKEALAMSVDTMSCSQLALVMNATGLQLYTPEAEFSPWGQPVWPSARAYIEEHFPLSPMLTSSSYANASLQTCYCVNEPWGDLSLKDMLEHPLREACPKQWCPSMATRSFSMLPNIDFCVDWIKDYATQIGLTLIASVAIVAVNQLLLLVIRVLSQFEAHITIDRLQASMAKKMLITAFFNTGVLTLLVNAYIPGVSDPQSENTLFSDFTSQWYAEVGTVLSITLCIQAILPQFVTFVQWYRVVRKRKALNAPSQDDLNARFLGPKMRLGHSYSYLVMYAFVAITYSAGVPVMLWVAFFAFTLAYWVSFIGFTRVYRTPPDFSIDTGRQLSKLLPYAVIINLAFAVWMFGQDQLFMGAAAGISIFGGDMTVLYEVSGASQTDSFGKEVWSRLSQSNILPVVILLGLAVGFVGIRLALHILGRAARQLLNIITCGNGCICCCRGDLELEGIPPCSVALDKDSPPDLQMSGMRDYNMLLNPDYQRVFGITQSFAETHTSLGDIANFTSDDMEKATRRSRRASLLTAGLRSESAAISGLKAIEEAAAQEAAEQREEGTQDGGDSPPPAAAAVAAAAASLVSADEGDVEMVSMASHTSAAADESPAQMAAV